MMKVWCSNENWIATQFQILTVVIVAHLLLHWFGQCKIGWQADIILTAKK